MELIKKLRILAKHQCVTYGDSPKSKPEWIAADEIESLRAKLATAKDSLEKAYAQLAQYKQDAERFKWLANRVLACDYGDNNLEGIWIGWRIINNLRDGVSFMFGSSINEAIDAAMKEV